MSGAVQSGLRAASEVLFHLRPQVVSAQELAMTAYGPSSFTPKTKPKGGKARALVKVTLGIGAVVAIVIIGKKVAGSLNEK